MGLTKADRAARKAYRRVRHIYCIQGPDGDYVGCAVNVGNRWRAHVCDAKAGSYFALHEAIRKYGEQAFSVSTVASAVGLMAGMETEQKVIIGLLQSGVNLYNSAELTADGKHAYMVKAKTIRENAFLRAARDAACPLNFLGGQS